MDGLYEVLAAFAAIAAIVGTVVGVLQYRLNRQQVQVSQPTAAQPREPQPREPQPYRIVHERSRPAYPPGVVRAGAGWILVETVITIGMVFWLGYAVVSNLGGFDLDVETFPEAAAPAVAAIAAALVGLITLPKAIRWGARLREGDAEIRTKLLGMTVIDIFGAVIISVIAVALNESWPIPEPVLTVLSTYLVFAIISAIIYIVLLTHRGTRAWVSRPT